MTDEQMTAAPLVAPRIDSTQWYSGATVALEIHAVSEGIRNGDWVEGSIGGLGVAAEAVGVIVDPIGTLARQQDMPSWQDGAADIYRGLAQSRSHTMDGLAEAAEGMSGLAEAVQMVVNAVRSGVRAMISFLVGKLISWAIELAATALAAAPLVIEQAMVAIGQTAVKVFRMVNDLMSSLKKLHDALQKYKLLITALRTGIGVAAGKYAYTPYGETP